jgi:hypothetical protein
LCERRTQQVLSRRVAVLMTVAGMVVLMLALASMAWASGTGGGPGGFGGPTVVKTVPADATVDVDVDTNVKAKFSKAMKARSINTNTFYLEVQGCGVGIVCTPGSLVPATVKYNDDTKTAVLNPTAPLTFNTTYRAVVEGTGDGDRKAVKDKGGTPLAADYDFFFNTEFDPTGCGSACE